MTSDDVGRARCGGPFLDWRPKSPTQPLFSPFSSLRSQLASPQTPRCSPVAAEPAAMPRGGASPLALPASTAPRAAAPCRQPLARRLLHWPSSISRSPYDPNPSGRATAPLDTSTAPPAHLAGLHHAAHGSSKRPASSAPRFSTSRVMHTRPRPGCDTHQGRLAHHRRLLGRCLAWTWSTAYDSEEGDHYQSPQHQRRANIFEQSMKKYLCEEIPNED